MWYILTAIGTAVVCIPFGAWFGFLVLMEALKQSDEEVRKQPRRMTMSLDRAIESGKEKRKQYRGVRAVDRTCRPGGNCPYCEGNRTYQDRRDREAADDAVREFEQE